MKKELSDKKEETKNAEVNEKKGDTAENKADKSNILQTDPAYKSGKRLYDIGLGIMSVILVLNLFLTFMDFEIYIGGVICSRFVIFIYLIPCILMIIGLLKSNKAAKKLETKGKGDKTCFIIISALAVFIVFGGTFEAFFPSYHVYDIENAKASDGREFLAVKSETVNMFGERHEKMPGFYDIDIYNVNGIFAKKVISCPVHDGEYEIEKMDDGRYRLVVSYLGREEGYPFEG